MAKIQVRSLAELVTRRESAFAPRPAGKTFSKSHSPGSGDAIRASNARLTTFFRHVSFNKKAGISADLVAEEFE